MSLQCDYVLTAHLQAATRSRCHYPITSPYLGLSLLFKICDTREQNVWDGFFSLGLWLSIQLKLPPAKLNGGLNKKSVPKKLMYAWKHSFLSLRNHSHWFGTHEVVFARMSVKMPSQPRFRVPIGTAMIFRNASRQCHCLNYLFSMASLFNNYYASQ